MTGRRNLKSSLRGRFCPDPMRDFDALPPALRQWLAHAHLPWSTRSVRKVWLRHHPDTTEAIRFLDRIERATLARDTAKIWGKTHPQARV